MKIETSVKWLYALEDNLHPSVLANTITQKSDFADLLRKLKKNIQDFRPYLLNAVSRSKLSMYYFIYVFGNGVDVRFDREGVSITKQDINEMDGNPLGDGMKFIESL